MPSTSANEPLYTTPTAMAPLMPEDSAGELKSLALQVVENAAKLSNSIHPLTGKAIAEFLRPINSYYSNLIEGHDTHPIDIANALKQDYAEDKDKRALQLEAEAHINTHRAMAASMEQRKQNPVDIEFLKFLHREFYQHLPEEFKVSKNLQGVEIPVVPGELRQTEIKVGSHIGPSSQHLASFVHSFEETYKDVLKSTDRLQHIIAIAASHHRLAWIHPFLDGNGRVTRLFTDALFIYEGLEACGLWSMSRGLAREREVYQTRLANADAQRQGNYDGRGNLSNRALVEFCRFFLEVAIDQIRYMTQVLAIDKMLSRIHSFTDLMVHNGQLKNEARHVLEMAFLKGEVSKKEVERLTGKSDKPAKAIADSLVQLELLKTDATNRFAPYRVSYPIRYASLIFSGVLPKKEELDMWESVTRLKR